MDIKLEEKLYDIDPIFFEQAIACKNGLMNQMSTCMAFGCECGDGWFEPIKKFVQKTAILNNVGKQYNIKFVCNQLKEKFGQFTCYTGNYAINEDKPIDDSEQVDALIKMFEDAKQKCFTDCYHVCEKCGAKNDYNNKNIVTTNGWISRICRKCSQESMIQETKRYDERNHQQYVPRITLLKQGFYFLNMFYCCKFRHEKQMFNSIIEAYIEIKDLQHKYIYSHLDRKIEESSFTNYMIFKQFGGKLLQEDYQLIKSITKSRFSDHRNKDDLANLFRTVGYEFKNMGNHCDNIYGHCVCDRCKNIEHKDLYAKILTEVRKELLEQNQLKQNDVCWKDGIYYLRDNNGNLYKEERWVVSNYQRQHDIKDSDIKILI